MASDLKGAVLLSRTRQERDFPLPDKPAIAIGNSRENDLTIAFEGVSRRHARISCDGKDYWIQDVGSTNGTFLNAIPLKARERLKHLDIVGLGRRADLIFVRRSVDLSRKTRRGILEARLEILDGLEAGSSRKIPRGSITIGRSHSNNIVTDSQLVSKVHARLDRSGVELLLTDLQSANGTFVNGEKIDSKVLKDGDQIRVGHSRSYRVRIEEGDVVTRDVPMPRATTSSENASLPSAWKTGMEWSPEEAAVFEQALTGLQAEAPRKSKPGKTAVEPRPTRPAQPVQAVQPAAGPPEAAKAEAATIPPVPAAPAPPARPSVPIGDVTTRAMEPSEAVAARLLLESEHRAIPIAIGTHEIGRSTECAIRLEGPAISRRHAVLRVSETEVVLEDHQTANGTYVNRERLTAPRALANGDVVTFGTTTFRVRLAPASAAKPPEKPE